MNYITSQRFKSPGQACIPQAKDVTVTLLQEKGQCQGWQAPELTSSPENTFFKCPPDSEKIYQSAKPRAARLLKCQLQFMPKKPSWPSLMLHSAKALGHPSLEAPPFYSDRGQVFSLQGLWCPWPRFPDCRCLLLQKFSLRPSQMGYSCLF